MRTFVPVFGALSGAFFGALALGICSCGGASVAPARPDPSAAAAPSAPAPVVADTRERRLKRSVIHAVVAQGLGAFLQHVELDGAPVRVAGKFRGFRIAALRDAQLWSGVDLQPGDVITRVNGFPIERPEQAQTAFESLEVAGELRVSYERDGEPRELVYPIVDDR
jgi:type II secretory pathway component PulC